MRSLLALLLAAALAGCAGVPVLGEPLPWRDDRFADVPASAITAEDLFRLPPELLRELHAPEVQALRPKQRLAKLLDVVYGPDRRRFDFAAGHSTVASETWRLRRGDCISLTLLTYGAARALGLQAVMQEVHVPAVYDRRGELDYVNHHVNVLVLLSSERAMPVLLRADDVIIDFEPEFASTARGQPLSDDAVLARYLNNLGVEALARQDLGLAHAYLRAAVRAQPGYAATYTNLGALYLERGLLAEAEQWLRRSVALAESPEHPLRALHQLLVAQGRTAEAAEVAARLRSWQENDPYYWVAEGIRHLRDAHPREAVRALQKAQDMTHGFTEVHRYLALAYWRLGEATQAREQLALLAQLNAGDPMGAKLRRKFNTQFIP